MLGCQPCFLTLWHHPLAFSWEMSQCEERREAGGVYLKKNKNTRPSSANWEAREHQSNLTRPSPSSRPRCLPTPWCPLPLSKKRGKKSKWLALISRLSSYLLIRLFQMWLIYQPWAYNMLNTRELKRWRGTLPMCILSDRTSHFKAPKPTQVILIIAHPIYSHIIVSARN